jgi:nitrate reductase cytochrome c-type subunit
MPLTNPWKTFLVSADTTGVLANDQVLGDLGKGTYAITAVSAAAADGTITINDGISDVVSLAAIPVRAAAVTFPEVRKNEDRRWIINYIGRGPTIPINIADGTNAEISLVVEFLAAS